MRLFTVLLSLSTNIRLEGGLLGFESLDLVTKTIFGDFGGFARF